MNIKQHLRDDFHKNPLEHLELMTVGNTKMKTENLEKNNVNGFTDLTEEEVYAQNGYEINLSFRRTEFNGSPKIASA